MRRTLLIGLLTGLACAPRTASDPRNDRSARADAATGPVLTLERRPCFGGCPVYSVSVSSSGLVTYQGKAHVRRLGAANGEITVQRLDSLLTELDRKGYFGFADRYRSSEPACGLHATDAPVVITSVTHRGRTKRVEHDYGCSRAPGALVVLERRIDEVLGSARWTGR